MPQLSVGIVGTGEIAATHAAVLAEDDRVKLTHVYDVDGGRAEAFGHRFDATAAESAGDVFMNVDAAYITAPNTAHAELTLEALSAGIHVFCEKPFALNLRDAKYIEEGVHAAGVVYQLGFSRRFAPAYREMRTLIQNGTLAPRSFAVKMNRGELQHPPWTSDATMTGGFLFESTLHLIDMVRFLLGEVRQITAVGTKAVYPCVDNFSCLFEMENGAHGVFSSCAHTTWIFPFERVELYGDHAAIFNDEMDAVTYCLGLEQEQVTKRFTTLPLADRWGFRAENRVFIDRVTGAAPEMKEHADERDGRRNVELIEAIYDQVGLGR